MRAGPEAGSGRGRVPRQRALCERRGLLQWPTARLRTTARNSRERGRCEHGPERLLVHNRMRKLVSSMYVAPPRNLRFDRDAIDGWAETNPKDTVTKGTEPFAMHSNLIRTPSHCPFALAHALRVPTPRQNRFIALLPPASAPFSHLTGALPPWPGPWRPSLPSTRRWLP